MSHAKRPVAMLVIPNKTVLHVLDGIKGLYHGGPSARPQFVWEHRTLYFASDPVALDHVCWKAIDEQRGAVGMKPIAAVEPDIRLAGLRPSCTDSIPPKVEFSGLV